MLSESRILKLHVLILHNFVQNCYSCAIFFVIGSFLRQFPLLWSILLSFFPFSPALFHFRSLESSENVVLRGKEGERARKIKRSLYFQLCKIAFLSDKKGTERSGAKEGQSYHWSKGQSAGKMAFGIFFHQISAQKTTTYNCDMRLGPLGNQISQMISHNSF